MKATYDSDLVNLVVESIKDIVNKRMFNDLITTGDKYVEGYVEGYTRALEFVLTILECAKDRTES